MTLSPKPVAVAAAICLLGTSCVTPPPPGSEGWQCTADTAVGDTTATATRWLSPSGRELNVDRSWKWRLLKDGADISIQQWPDMGLNGDLESKLLVFVNLPDIVRRRTMAVELRTGEGAGAAADPSFSQRQRHMVQYSLILDAGLLQGLAAAGRPISIAALDGKGEAIFEARLDMSAVSRGQEAMRLADQSSAEASRAFRTRCVPDRSREIGDLILT